MGGDVVVGCVFENVVESVGFGDVFGFFVEDDGEFGFVVGWVGGDGVFGDDGGFWVGVGKVGRGF